MQPKVLPFIYECDAVNYKHTWHSLVEQDFSHLNVRRPEWERGRAVNEDSSTSEKPQYTQALTNNPYFGVAVFNENNKTLSCILPGCWTICTTTSPPQACYAIQ